MIMSVAAAAPTFWNGSSDGGRGLRLFWGIEIGDQTSALGSGADKLQAESRERSISIG